jgi:alpha-beta hydrolase superfamily lysophospholipase
MPELMGTDILYRRWNAAPPAAPPKGVFLHVHGLGAHTARWDFIAGFLARNGFSSYGIELRGFGQTPERPRGHVDSLRVWEQDILKLREIAAAKNPGQKIFVLGESVGGLVAFNLACRHPEAFAGQILLSPDFKNGLKFPLSSYLMLAAFIPFKPRKTLAVPFTSAMCTRDTAYQSVMDRSPDELRVASLKCLMSILAEQMKSKRLARDLRIPSLFLISGADLLVDERAGRELFKNLTLEDKTILEYPDMLHALSIDLGRERVFRDILDWAEKRV